MGPRLDEMLLLAAAEPQRMDNDGSCLSQCDPSGSDTFGKQVGHFRLAQFNRRRGTRATSPNPYLSGG